MTLYLNGSTGISGVDGSSGTPAVQGTDTNTGISFPAADTVAVNTGGSERVRVDSSGRLGVGTASPARLLHVANSAADASIAIDGGSGNAAFLDFRIAGTNKHYIGSANLLGSGTNSDMTVWNSANGYLNFGTNGTERARIDSSGRLLVGTSSSPSVGDGQYARIVIQGYTGGATAQGYVALARGEAASTITAGEEIGTIAFTDSAGYSFAYIGCSADAAAGTNDYPGRLTFSVTKDGESAPQERFRIANDGAIYTNKAASASGNTNGVIFRDLFGQTTTTGGVEIITSASNLRYMITFRNDAVNGNASGAIVGSISTNGSATSYTTSSDHRLKENVEPVTDGIARLQQLKPSRFNFITDPDKTVDGFIAHEVQAVVPEAITGEKDAVDDDGNPIYQGIDQSKLVPLLTAALQEAIGEIESLKARVAALEAA